MHNELWQARLSIEEVQPLNVNLHPDIVELTGDIAPKDRLEGKFSVYHGGAAVVLFGKATPAEYEDDIVTNPEVMSVCGRFRVVVGETMRVDE